MLRFTAPSLGTEAMSVEVAVQVDLDVLQQAATIILVRTLHAFAALRHGIKHHLVEKFAAVALHALCVQPVPAHNSAKVVAKVLRQDLVANVLRLATQSLHSGKRTAVQDISASPSVHVQRICRVAILNEWTLVSLQPYKNGRGWLHCMRPGPGLVTPFFY